MLYDRQSHCVVSGKTSSKTRQTVYNPYDRDREIEKWFFVCFGLFDDQIQEKKPKMMKILIGQSPSSGFVKKFALKSFRFISDSRVKKLPLMDTPIPTAAFIIAYLCWVVVIGPLFMRDRKPFGLRNTLIYYNAFQVLLSAYMFYEVIRSIRHVRYPLITWFWIF